MILGQCANHANIAISSLSHIGVITRVITRISPS